MRVAQQKNVYYVDLSKNLYRGYVETELVLESGERSVVYRAAQLVIEEVILLDTMRMLEIVNMDVRKNNMATKKRRCEEVDGESEVKDELEARAVQIEEQQINGFRVIIPDEVADGRIRIRVVFRPMKNNTGVHWYRPVSEKDKHKEVIGCCRNGDSSLVAPYIDEITEMELCYVIPNTEDVKIVSSGVFKAIKEEDKTIVYVYSITTHPKYLMFAVGTYEQHDLFTDNDQRKLVTPSSVEGVCADVIADLQELIKYIEGFTKTGELASCNIVFSLVSVGTLIAKNMVVLDYNMLPSSKDIEMAYVLKRELAEALSWQVYYFLDWNICDSWIFAGFSGYLSDYCVRHILGNNEFLYGYFEDKQFVVNSDILQPPLFYTTREEYEINTEFFRKKSKLVFHSMEAHLSSAFIQKISDEVLDARKMGPGQSQQQSGELKKCFTERFIKILKDATGKDLRGFFDFYVFKPGLMKVKLNFQINKKKNSVKVELACKPTSMLPGANKRIPGSIDLKFYEIEGTFDHTVIQDNENVFLYHTRTKKKKKEEDEEVMPLLYIRVDPRRTNLFDYQVDLPDYMHLEGLQDKSVIGQLEAIQSLGCRPSLATCEALERMLENSHTFYKIRVNIIYILRTVNIEKYNGLQRLILYFIRTRCVSNSTVLKSNEFGLIPYFIQKHLVKGISQIDFDNEELLGDSKIVLAFLENILKFNDNSLSQFDDFWYVAAVINMFSLHCCLQACYKAPLYETERIFNGFQQPSDLDFFNVDSTLEMPRANTVSADPKLVENCVSEIERFRISDMVFPSNNNIITRTCIISYIRLAFYNKISLSRPALEALAMYPNLLSVRLVAMEGLMLLYSDSWEFILCQMRTELSIVVQKILEITIKVLLLGLRVHFMDTDEYDVNLTERLRWAIQAQIDGLFVLYAQHLHDRSAVLLLNRLLAIVENRHMPVTECTEKIIEKYSHSKEDENRQVILKMASTTRKIRVVGLDSLILSAFLKTWTLRLPRIKNYKIRAQKEPAPKHLRVRISPGRFMVKHLDEFRIRFRINRKEIKIREFDLSMIMAKRYCEYKGVAQIDEHISKNKTIGFFAWQPYTSVQILEVVREEKLTPTNTFRLHERALIFVMSYNLMSTRIYHSAKLFYAYIEQQFIKNSFICKSVCPMNQELRDRCEKFLESLIEDREYGVFATPVDTGELRNYVDIVRVPVSFSDVYSNMGNYCSFDAFVVHMRRIYMNCLNYNDSRSAIAEAAISLSKRIEEFVGTVDVVSRSSLEVMREVVGALNVEDLLRSLLEIITDTVTWHEIENEMAVLKKKYTRSSHNGKIVVSALKTVREQLKWWFLYDGVRVLVVEPIDGEGSAVLD